VSPSSGLAKGGTVVTITGARLTGATKVLFGTKAATAVTVNSDSQITATSPAGSGTVDVTVTTPNGTSAKSSADKFTYLAVPTVKSLSPNNGPPAGGTSVTITGTGFAGATAVAFGTTAASSFTVDSSTQITAVAPAGTAATTVDVTVTTPGGTSAKGTLDKYTWDGVPTITGLSPANGPVAGGNTVAVNGTNFASGSTKVLFGSTPGTNVTFVSTKQVTVTAPAGSAGSVDVTVITPGGTSATSSKDLYTYGAPPITSFTPLSGVTGSTVTITGTGFSPGMSVQFGSLASPTVTVSSGTTVKAVVPNGDPGAAAITVSNDQGNQTSTKQFTPTLSITDFTPSSGPAGTVVTIDGIGFTSTSVVKFNSVAASAVTFVSSTQLQATVPSGATTGLITVTNSVIPKGTVKSPSNFTVG
jgi:IPT/TIG domain